MNIAETATVLAKIKLGDSREVDDKGLTLRYWHELIGDLDMNDCLQAVVMHRMETDKYLQPFHVRENVRRLHQPRELHGRVNELFCPHHYGMPPKNCERCREDE